MSYRFMRMMLFFDLPIETAQERREYTRFRKMLIKNGFLMLQKSVYCKLALNQTAAAAILEVVRRNKPTKGIVQSLIVTEKQYVRMEYLVGEYGGDVINDDARFIEL